MMDKERELISSAFLLDVFRVLVENPNMTATQTLELMQERATLMSPSAGASRARTSGPVTEREIDLLTVAGQLPPMPPEMIEARGQYKITYTSPDAPGDAGLRGDRHHAHLRAGDPAGRGRPVRARRLRHPDGRPACSARSTACRPRSCAAPRTSPPRRPARAAQQQAAIVQAAPQISAAAKNVTQMQAAGGRPQV
jgi:hypothetical protein